MLIQSKELEAQRQELEQTRETLVKQLDILSAERRQQAEIYAEKQVRDYCSFMKDYLARNLSFSWTSAPKTKSLISHHVVGNFSNLSNSSPFSPKVYFDGFSRLLEHLNAEGVEARSPDDFEEFANYLEGVSSYLENLSDAQREHLSKLGFDRMLNLVDSVINNR